MTIGWYKEVDSMKKYIPFLLSLVVIMNFTISIVKAEQPLHHEEGKVTVAYIPTEKQDAFYHYMEMGGGKIYNIAEYSGSFESTYAEDGRKVLISAGFQYLKQVVCEKSEEYTPWLFGWHWVSVYSTYEVYNYIGQTSNIQKLLIDKGIDCEINDYMILSIAAYVPPVIWVDTNKGIYYIGLTNMNENDIFRGWIRVTPNYTYDVYRTDQLLSIIDAEYIKYQKYPPDITIDRRRVDISPPAVLKADTILVPVRELCEKMGATVDWDEEAQTVAIKKDSIIIFLTINSTTAILNGKKCELNVAPEIEEGKTLAPIRFIAESFGYNVNWVDGGDLARSLVEMEIRSAIAES